MVWLGCALGASHWPLSGAPVPKATLPPVVLWAWERTEDLRFLHPGEAGVAFLARTLEVHGKTFTVRSRRNPLHLPPGVPTVAVVRIEVDRPKQLEWQLAPMVHAIAELWELPGITGLQIDFDATRSQRAFYLDLLRRLCGTRPQGKGLSITALGSWCLGDPWIRDLPVDEAVPMLFRMGPEARSVKEALGRRGDFAVPLARTSVGYSLDEPFLPVPPGRRVYVFDPRPWTLQDFRSLKARLGR